MSTAIDEDLTVLEHLDFTPACETTWHRGEGEKPAATWYVHATACPSCGRNVDLFCDGCHEAAMQVNGKILTCRHDNTSLVWHVYSARRL